MNDKNIIVELIMQDLKQHLFRYRLEQAGLALDHTLDICHIVARLMGIPFGQLSDDWMDIYMAFMEEAKGYRFEDTEGLKKVAVRCYMYLRSFGNVEKRVSGY